MTITANSGPIVSFGQTQSSTGNGIIARVTDYNSQRGPSLFDLGQGMMDPRSAYQYQPGAGVTTKVVGFPNGQAVVDMVGLTSSSTNSFVTAGTSYVASQSLPLVTASSNKSTYATTIIAPETGLPVSVIAIDSTASVISFGSDATTAYWNPAGGSGRCLTFLATAADGGAWTIVGRDMYGYKMTEQVTVGTSATTSKRAFKYISAIYASSVLNSTGVNVTLSNVFGLPLAVNYVGPHLQIALSSNPFGPFANAVTSSAPDVNALSSCFGCLVFASTATADSSSTFDVRGLYVSSTALTLAASQRLMIRVTPTVSQLTLVSNTDVSSVFGVNQFSSV